MKQLSQILEQTANQLDLALSQTRVTIVNLDRNLRYISVINPVDGFADPDIVGKSIMEVHGPKQAPIIERARRSVLETGQPHHDFIEVSVNGVTKYYDTTVHPILGEGNIVEGVTVVSVDLSDLVLARRRMAEANERLLNVLDNALDPQ